MRKSLLSFTYILFTLLLTQCNKDTQTADNNLETVTDADGNVYKTIKLGNQVWMLQNLKTTKYNDGTPIAKWTFGSNWYYSLNPVALYQWANTQDLNKVYAEPLPYDYYGAMYNEIALISGKLAPNGWRIPSEQDFKTLEAHVASQGYTGNEATAIKSKTGWVASSGSGIDVFGFNALPNGYISHGGTATASELICSWATSDVNVTAQQRKIISLLKNGKIIFQDAGISLGAGVRCIKN